MPTRSVEGRVEPECMSEGLEISCDWQSKIDSAVTKGNLAQYARSSGANPLHAVEDEARRSSEPHYVTAVQGKSAYRGLSSQATE